MAFIQLQEMHWHQGELDMQEVMHAPHNDNPTVPALSPQLANHLQVAPLVALGILDESKRPWTTIWGGESGLGAAVAQGIIGLRTAVTGKYDPVIENLYGGAASGEVVREEGKGRMVSGLTIDLESRRRVKFFGRMIAGAMKGNQDATEAQLVLKIEQSLGNCPKYLNKKVITPAKSEPVLISESTQLAQHAQDLIHNADLFFISSAHDEEDMDTNHRGGPAGFLRHAIEDGKTVLYWPEYSGNRLYQTLGNLMVTPQAGVSIPDFLTGDMLYMTGRTEILVGKNASVLPKTTLAVKFTVDAARFVAAALPFRGTPGEQSPYNPTVRFLASEKKQTVVESALYEAVLLSQEKITSTISRYRFALDKRFTYRAGQYVTFDFSELLSMGYSHMRDDDPQSLNDDYVRTFTISSHPGETQQFEITIRHVGVVTHYMSKYMGTDHEDRQRLTVQVRGFGGDFTVEQKDAEDLCFIAAGVGVTPLLSALPDLDTKHLRLLWTLREADIPLLQDSIKRHPDLKSCAEIFITGEVREEAKQALDKLGVRWAARRLAAADVRQKATPKTYLCTAVPLRKQITEWLPNVELVFEDFNY